MSELGLPFLGSAALAALLVSLTIWSRRRLRFKIGVLGVFIVFAVVQYAALTDLLSRPKPIQLAWTPLDPDKTAVVASQMVEGEAIWIWTVQEGAAEPRAFTLPWSEEMARQLHEAKRESEEKGGAVRMRYNKESTQLVRGERVFYAEPQASPPAKQVSGTAGGLSSLTPAEGN